MLEKELHLIIRVAEIFKRYNEQILNNWISKVKEENLIHDEHELSFFKDGFTQLLDSFVTYLGNGDLQGYFSNNARIASQIAYNDISYKKFINAFHLFESSYSNIIEVEVDQGALLDYLGALDYLHHESIAIVSEEYFKIKDSTVFALAKLVEVRDPLTGFHLERTRDYAVLLAQKYPLGDDYVSQIYRVGPLHDIGKVAVADQILLKAGKLTEDEFNEIKKHTSIGAQAIESIIGNQVISRGYLNMAREIALYHHEKMDGSGYPSGLKGQDIPLAARIFALGDAYDAIVSPRSYKKALTHEEAVKRIVECRGTHFDPVVVDIFLQSQEEFKEIHNRYL